MFHILWKCNVCIVAISKEQKEEVIRRQVVNMDFKGMKYNLIRLNTDASVDHIEKQHDYIL